MSEEKAVLSASFDFLLAGESLLSLLMASFDGMKTQFLQPSIAD